MNHQTGRFLVGSAKSCVHYLRPTSGSAIRFSSSSSTTTATKKKQAGSLHIFRAGVPMLLFCGLGVWVVSNGIEGKNKERDAAQGRLSVSERQAMMNKEHSDMMQKMTHIVGQDFDNTKDKIMDEAKKSFKPEFLNRLTEIVIFRPLAKESMSSIVDLKNHKR